jgi:hypothetical protein
VFRAVFFLFARQNCLFAAQIPSPEKEIPSHGRQFVLGEGLLLSEVEFFHSGGTNSLF